MRVVGDDIVATHAEGAANEREPLLVLEPLRRFLDEHGLGTGGVEAQPLGEGHSNVTYLIRRGDTELVLRRPPRGPLAPTAHDVLREARLLRAIEDTAARVPRVLAACDDRDVIGTPFHVTALVPGDAITGAVPAQLDTPPERRRMSEELVDALVEVHGVDWAACGLEGFSRDPGAYLERQLRRFAGLWDAGKTRELTAVEEVGRWLGDYLPTSGPPTIVHGDYRLGNVIMSPAVPARLAAILDWEMATIGDPLADLGYLCTLWVDRDDDEPPGLFARWDVTRRDGFLSRDELVARYEERSGRAMSDIRWYRVLALWKATVFMEGNYRRALAGTTDDPYLKGFADGVVELAERARELSQAG
ncbi:MAG: phosphotransferase family protein [Actinomycetota bacterium]|nr:phosphotransferase family protein [Actinomycetota bacterium]